MSRVAPGKGSSSKGRAKKEYYVDGNVVRRLEAAPDYREVERHKRELERRQKEEKQRREHSSRKRAAARNQQRALQMSKGYVAFLTMAVTVFGIFSGTYIKLQSDMTARIKSISSLESQVSDLKSENDETYKRLTTSVNLADIRQRALGELGMSYAKESQIVYYTVDDDDYMTQYGDIPTK